MEQAEIEEILMAALQSLYEEELQTIQLDIGERMICSQLRAILQRSFLDHSVHAEYNRHGIEPKDIEMPNAEGELTHTRVLPDIIVHQPMHDDANLLVIEAKKSTNQVADASDLSKLEQMKWQLGYSYAVFIRLPAGPAADVANIQLTWV
jgi:hypothetical protein